MAISLKQSVTGSLVAGAGPLTVTLNSVVSGALLTVTFSYYQIGNSTAIATPTDSGGTWVAASAPGGGRLVGLAFQLRGRRARSCRPREVPRPPAWFVVARDRVAGRVGANGRVNRRHHVGTGESNAENRPWNRPWPNSGLCSRGGVTSAGYFFAGARE